MGLNTNHTLMIRRNGTPFKLRAKCDKQRHTRSKKCSHRFPDKSVWLTSTLHPTTSYKRGGALFNHNVHVIELAKNDPCIYNIYEGNKEHPKSKTLRSVKKYPDLGGWFQRKCDFGNEKKRRPII